MMPVNVRIDSDGNVHIEIATVRSSRYLQFINQVTEFNGIRSWTKSPKCPRLPNSFVWAINDLKLITHSGLMSILFVVLT